MTLQEVTSAVKDLGVPVALLAWFAWRVEGILKQVSSALQTNAVSQTEQSAALKTLTSAVGVLESSVNRLEKDVALIRRDELTPLPDEPSFPGKRSTGPIRARRNTGGDQ